MKWIKRLVLALFILVILPLLLVIFMSQSSSDSRTFELKDGKVLRIEQLTWGSTHQFGPPPFIGALKQILPSLPILPSIRHQTPSETLVLWLTSEDLEQDFMFPMTNVVRAVARDKHGSRYLSTDIELRDEGHWRSQPSWGGNQTPPPTSKWFITLISFRQYPRGEETFDVELLDQQENVIQSMEIANPQLVQPNEWKPTTLPVQHMHGDLKIRLNNFTNTWHMQHIGREYGEIPQFKADFEFLTKDEKGAPYWLFDSGQGMDTFGNSVTFSGYEAGNLSHQSRAWRISYDFFQHHDARFPADQVWELTLDIPEEGKSRSVELEKELMGIPIKLLNVTGPKTKAVYKDGILESAEFAEQANGTSLSSSSTYVGGTFIRTVTFTSKDPYIGVNFPQNDHSHRIEILAKHENGSYLPLSFRSRSQDHQFIGIREIPDSSELELKVIVKPVFRKSFLVQPMVTPPVHRFKNPDAIPERSPEAPPQTMDLSEYYTEKLDSHIHITGRMGTGSYGTSFNYFSVKPGIHQINNQVWDLRGIVLMTGKSLFNNYLNYPEKIEGIPIASRASKIHFLHGCLWPGDPDEEIGNYRIHYSNGTHQTIPLVYGKNIANVWNQPGQTIVTDIEMAKLVEIPEKSDPAPGREKLAYHFAWENPSPDLIIERIEIQSNRKTQAPLLLGITLE